MLRGRQHEFTLPGHDNASSKGCPQNGLPSDYRIHQWKTVMWSDLSTAFTGKRILVVGGTGSIGAGLTRALLELKPAVVRVLSNDENGLFEMQRDLAGRPQLRFLLGDVRDRERLALALRDIDIVFHAAALKHVPTSEYNPFEVVQTNVIGTQNLLETAIWRGVEKFVFISTDKAVNPLSTLGASKLLCEKLVLDAASYGAPTAFSCVRFGNVLGTRGSVTNVFISQIANGGPVTITVAYHGAVEVEVGPDLHGRIGGDEDAAYTAGVQEVRRASSQADDLYPGEVGSVQDEPRARLDGEGARVVEVQRGPRKDLDE